VADSKAIGTAIRRLLADRAINSSICPSEVARHLYPADEPAWRAAMPLVLEVAFDLADRGQVRVTRGSEDVDPASPGKGPVRLRRGPQFSG
jgi:hypothetical protein